MARGGCRLRQVADCMKRFGCSARDIHSSRYIFTLYIIIIIITLYSLTNTSLVKEATTEAFWSFDKKTRLTLLTFVVTSNVGIDCHYAASSKTLFCLRVAF